MNALAGTVPSASVTHEQPLSVLWVDDDPEYLDRAAELLADEDGVDVITETSPMAATGRLADVDCVVCDYAMSAHDGLELLAAVREDWPTLPFVLCTGSSLPEAVEAVADDEWTELVRTEGTDLTVSLVAARCKRLVADRRSAALAGRALAGLDEASDAIAVVAPDDTFAVVNHAFARRLGYAREELLGRDWQTCFPDHEVDRLESTALETVSEDWRWTGGCIARRADGTTITAQTQIAGLDDDSVVFSLADASDDE